MNAMLPAKTLYDLEAIFQKGFPRDHSLYIAIEMEEPRAASKVMRHAGNEAERLSGPSAASKKRWLAVNAAEAVYIALRNKGGRRILAQLLQKVGV